MNHPAVVYWIRHKNHTDIFSEGYVGVSKNPQKRWKKHKSDVKNGKHENKHLSNAFIKYNKSEIVFETVLIAEENYCYKIENQLRNLENTGWNIAVGGNRPPTAKSRGVNYQSPLKGISRKTPWMVGKKLTDEQKQNLRKFKFKKVKFQNIVFESFQALAKHLNIKYSTLTNRIYRNPTKWGYEVME